MSERNPTIFISYSRSENPDTAHKIASALAHYGHESWLADTFPAAQQATSSQLERAIGAAELVLVCLLPSPVAEGEASATPHEDIRLLREVTYAQVCEKPILPLLCDGAKPADMPPSIQHLVPVQVDDANSMPGELLAWLADPPPFQPPTAHPQGAYLRHLYHWLVGQLAVRNIAAGQGTPYRVKCEGIRLIKTPQLTKEQTDDVIEFGFDHLISLPEIFDDLSQAFNQNHHHVWLLGAGGGGKTLLLLAHLRDAVCRCWQDTRQPLPVFAPLDRWPPAGTILEEWLAGLWPQLSPEVIQRHLEEGKLYLLCDGLDELGRWETDTREVPAYDPATGNLMTTRQSGILRRKEVTRMVERDRIYDPRVRFLQMIEQRLKEGEAQHNYLMIACRTFDYETLGDRLELGGKIQLLPVSREQMEILFQNYPPIRQALARHAGLSELLAVPVMLSLLLNLLRGVADGGESLLADLYRAPGDMRQNLLRLLAERWYADARQEGDLASLVDIYEILGHIAFEDYRRDTYPDNRELTYLEYDLLHEEVDWIIESAYRAGYLIRVREDEQGRPVFRYWHAVLRGHFLLYGCWSHLKNGSLPARQKALKILSLLGSPQARAYIQQALDDQELVASINSLNWPADVLAALVDNLGQIADGRVLPVVLDLLTHEKGWIRERAAEALGHLANKEAIAALKAAAYDDINLSVRRNAILALEKMGYDLMREQFLDTF